MKLDLRPAVTDGRMYGPTAWVTVQFFELENAFMPWKESRALDERLKFIAQLLSEEPTMADLCRNFGISRKTGYKWKKRYEVGGAASLVDLSRMTS